MPARHEHLHALAQVDRALQEVGGVGVLLNFSPSVPAWASWRCRRI